MGLADYQKQREIKEATEANGVLMGDVRDTLRRLLEEQKRTNSLLAELVALGAAVPPQ